MVIEGVIDGERNDGELLFDEGDKELFTGNKVVVFRDDVVSLVRTIGPRGGATAVDCGWEVGRAAVRAAVGGVRFSICVESEPEGGTILSVRWSRISNNAGEPLGERGLGFARDGREATAEMARGFESGRVGIVVGAKNEALWRNKVRGT